MNRVRQQRDANSRNLGLGDGSKGTDRHLVDARVFVFSLVAGSCLCALVVLAIIDWLTGLHNAALSLGLAISAMVLGSFAAARIIGSPAKRGSSSSARLRGRARG